MGAFKQSFKICRSFQYAFDRATTVEGSISYAVVPIEFPTSCDFEYALDLFLATINNFKLATSVKTWVTARCLLVSAHLME